MDRNIIPRDDDSTLFICSGMQPLKRRFYQPDGGKHGSLQSCVRTDDIDLVGDGSHLTYFEMLGNFSFGGDDFPLSVDLWHSVLSDLGIRDVSVRVHSTQSKHRRLWERRGYRVDSDDRCVWSDGTIGGYCCELFVGDLEIGNLVQPLEHSTDVGFGWERLLQVIEGKSRVDQTTLFDSQLHPIVSDHSRTLSLMKENNIEPGNKGRNYVCRRLSRRVLQLMDGTERFPFDDWLEQERQLREENLRQAKRHWRKHQDKPPQFWWETFGLLRDEIDLLRHS